MLVQYTVKRNSDGGFGFSISGGGRDNCVKVCRVNCQSHAWRVGLEVDDELVKVNSMSVSHLSVNNVAAIIRYVLYSLIFTVGK